MGSMLKLISSKPKFLAGISEIPVPPTIPTRPISTNQSPGLALFLINAVRLPAADTPGALPLTMMGQLGQVCALLQWHMATVIGAAYFIDLNYQIHESIGVGYDSSRSRFFYRFTTATSPRR